MNWTIFKFILIGKLTIIFTNSLAQERKITGIVTDSLLNPLSYVNVIVVPEKKSSDLKYAVTDDKGRFKLVLSSQEKYEISFTFLGYEKQIITVYVDNQDINYSVKMYPSTNMLGEVVILDQPIVKNHDTLSYNIEAFRTGDERKLKDLMEKLPGVNLDKNGQVIVQGKKVSKLTVDGKDFFNGGTKLAIENIPSDAVGRIEFIDKYQSVGFLKDFEESDEMAMNVRLKKEKKKFCFGDVNFGSDFNDKYLIHPNLFYYSPKTNINFIGDVNNSGQNLFTFSNVMDFEGGVSALLRDGLFNNVIFDNELYNLTETKDFVSSKNTFGALNFNSYLTSKLKLSLYVIGSKTIDDFISQYNKNFFLDELSYSEKLDLNSITKNKLGLARMVIDFRPSESEAFYFQTKIKGMNENKIINNISFIDDSISKFEKLNINDIISLNQLTEWNKRISGKRVISVGFNIFVNKVLPNTEWLSDFPLFTELLPLVTDSFYQVKQNVRIDNILINFILKHYWNITNHSQINIVVGNNYLNESYSTLVSQYLLDNTVINYDEQGYENKVNFQANDFFMGMFIKFKKKNFTLNSGFYTHFYTRKDKQDSIIQFHKFNVLPDISLKFKLKSAQELNISYKILAQFPQIQDLAENYIVKDYYILLKGNKFLDNEFYHSANLYFSDFSMYRNLILHFRLSLNKKITGIIYQTQIENQNQFISPITLNNPEINWAINTGINKGIGRIRLILNLNLQINQYLQSINTQISTYTSVNQLYEPEIRTNLKKWPNISISCKFVKSTLYSGMENYSIVTSRPCISLKYDFLSGFLIKADYSMEINRTRTTNQLERFDIANSSIYYQSPKSAWGFEFCANNILNRRAKISNEIYNYSSETSRIYVFPRTLLFSVSYHL